MKVLILNPTSPLGTAMGVRLRGEGHDVVGMWWPGQRVEDVSRALLRDAGVPIKARPVAPVFEEAAPDVVIDLRGSPGGTAKECGAELASFGEVLSLCRARRTPLVFVSSQDVYGANDKLPFGVEQPLERQLSVRGAADRGKELLAQAVAHQDGVPITALRLFELYGPNVPGFVHQCILSAGDGVAMPLRGDASARRDFVFVDDAVEIFARASERPPDPVPGVGPWAVHNVGSGTPTPLSGVMALVGERVGRPVTVDALPPDPRELPHTWADVRELQQAYGFRPKTSLADGVAKTVAALLAPVAAE